MRRLHRLLGRDTQERDEPAKDAPFCCERLRRLFGEASSLGGPFSSATDILPKSLSAKESTLPPPRSVASSNLASKDAPPPRSLASCMSKMIEPFEAHVGWLPTGLSGCAGAPLPVSIGCCSLSAGVGLPTGSLPAAPSSIFQPTPAKTFSSPSEGSIPPPSSAVYIIFVASNLGPPSGADLNEFAKEAGRLSRLRLLLLTLASRSLPLSPRLPTKSFPLSPRPLIRSLPLSQIVSTDDCDRKKLGLLEPSSSESSRLASEALNNVHCDSPIDCRR